MCADKWCYFEEWYCPEESDRNILVTAVGLYGSGEFEWGTYEDTPHEGESADGSHDWLPTPDGNDLREIDCYWLVANTLRKLNYDTSKKKRDENDDSVANQFGDHFCQVRIEDAGRGDIIFFRSSQPDSGGGTAGLTTDHIGIIYTNYPGTDWCREGSYFSSDSEENIDFQDWHSSGCDCEGTTNDRGLYGATITIWRPMKQRQVPEECDAPDKAEEEEEEEEHRDPLILDLDGNGARSLGLNAGIYFDHDGNGFKELSGWAAPGDGMLMLDRNGNGTLDADSELLGDATILSNGLRAANGFEALAYYDANDDGKIDASDPIWPQLRVWQHATYIVTAGDG